jgi:hypothetical protein
LAKIISKAVDSGRPSFDVSVSRGVWPSKDPELPAQKKYGGGHDDAILLYETVNKTAANVPPSPGRSDEAARGVRARGVAHSARTRP